MKKTLLSTASSTLLAALVLSTAACDFFNEPPPRYNTVVGAKRSPILNPGGEGPATIPLQQFEETDRYTTQYPSPEDMQALEEAQSGMESLPAPAPEPEVQAAQPAEVMGEYSADMPVEEGPRRRPLAQAEFSQTDSVDQQPLQSFDDVGQLPTDHPSVAMTQPAPAPVVEQAPVTSAPVERQAAAPAQASSWSDNPNPPADSGTYPQLSSVPPVPTDVKQNAAATKAEFADVAQQGEAQTARAQQNQDAVDELNRALEAEAQQQPISTYQPAALPPAEQVNAAPLEQPLPPQEMAALPAPTEPVPAPAPAPAEPQWQPAPMEIAPAQQASTPINNFQMPEPTAQEQNYPPVAMAAPAQDVYGAPADGLAPIQLVPPSQVGSSARRPTLPPSRYEARRMGYSAGGSTYRHY